MKGSAPCGSEPRQQARCTMVAGAEARLCDAGAPGLPVALTLTLLHAQRMSARRVHRVPAHLPGGRRARYSADVELSAKVVDAPAKLRATLLHELCHVAAWLLPPHAVRFTPAQLASALCVMHPVSRSGSAARPLCSHMHHPLFCPLLSRVLLPLGCERGSAADASALDAWVPGA